MRVEDINILQTHALEALIETRDQIFARAPVAVRAVPHGVAGFGADNEFVAMRGKVGLQDATEIFFRGTRRRTVIVGEIEMRDAEIERAAQHRATGLEDINPTKVVPEAERDRGKINTALTAAAVLHG